MFNQRIIEEIQKDEIGINRINNMRYNYIVVTYELDNLGSTLGSRGELGYIKM